MCGSGAYPEQRFLFLSGCDRRRCAGGTSDQTGAWDRETLAEQPSKGKRLYLKIEAHAQAYSFYYAVEPGEWIPVAEAVMDAFLSTPVAGGFLGTYIGMYASSNGLLSTNFVDFDWFTYTGVDEA